MSKAIRTALSLVVSLVLLSTLNTAQTAPSTDKKEDKAHHSRLTKAAFWRHHPDAGTKTKPATAASTKPQSQKPQSQKPQAKPAQLKPVSAKTTASKNDQKPQKPSNSSDISKSTPKKAPVAGKLPAANKTKPQPKAQTHETASLQQ